MGGIPVPDDSKRARIVLQLVGPVPRLQLRHVPSDWPITSRPCGCDVAGDADRLRRAAEKRGYVVEPSYTVEDWNPQIEGMMKS